MNKHGAHFIPAKVLSNSLGADIMIMHTEKLKYFAPESKSCNNKKKTVDDDFKELFMCFPFPVCSALGGGGAHFEIYIH